MPTKDFFENLFTTKKILISSIIAGIIILCLVIYMKSHYYQIQTIRNQKNKFFLTSSNSPIISKENFKSLNYFPTNSSYKVEAELNPIEDDSMIQIWSSDGKKILFKKFALLKFTINQTSQQLFLYQSITINKETDSKTYFLPFRDLTNNKTTYQSGRYLDLEITEKNITNKLVELDFNLSYNPYCVYNYKYSCPLAPKENSLKIEINAGEKRF
ncbi:MAG: DUF1684 domain-containing protein [Cytophagales bacterium]|nr:MAG: DUF1684 domain-containing protein [Cytophagales bacterium]